MLRGKVLYLDKLTVSFDRFKALDALTLHVDPGELLCIIGPNGAGKTTMMDVITGKTRPDAGTAWFGPHVNLLALTEPEIAQAGIGRKFQKPTVFEFLSVFENLELALADDKSVWHALVARLTPVQRERIDEVLHMIGLEAERTAMAGVLSHGQKQWLEIGMLLMQDPELLLVDEPVAGIDAAGEEQFHSMIRRLNRDLGITIVMVSHDIGAVMREATTIACINTDIVFHGPVHQLDAQALSGLYGFPVDVLMHDPEHTHR